MKTLDKLGAKIMEALIEGALLAVLEKTSIHLLTERLYRYLIAKSNSLPLPLSMNLNQLVQLETLSSYKVQYRIKYF